MSEHDGDCQTCDRREDCELQALSAELGIRTITYAGQKTRKRIDLSTPGLMRDHGKCIKCRRCVSVCAETQHVGRLVAQGRGFDTAIGPAFNRDLTTVACVQCGQCAAVCPVGAITEQSQVDRVWDAIDDPAQACRRADGPGDSRRAGRVLRLSARHAGDRQDDDRPAPTGLRCRVRHELRRGPDDPGRRHGTADATATALVDKEHVALPMFTSCSPGWILFAEYFHPQILPNLSTCKSPQQMFGALAKTYYAEKLGLKPEQIFVTSVMPCTAKKFECQRPEMCASGSRDVDAVLTTRELGKMIRAAGIDFRRCPTKQMDAPLGLSTGAADIFANTGGVMEAALRTAYEIVTGRPLPVDNLHVAPVAGLAGVKEAVADDRAAAARLVVPGRRRTARGRRPRTGQCASADRAVCVRREAVSLHRSDDLPRRLHRRRRPAAVHGRQRAAGPHRRHLPGGRRQDAPQVPREPGRRRPLPGVPRPTAGRTFAPPAAHQVQGPQPGVEQASRLLRPNRNGCATGGNAASADGNGSRARSKIPSVYAMVRP